MKILELTRLFHPSIGGIQKFVDSRLKIYGELQYNYQVVTTLKNKNKSNLLKDVVYLNSYTPYYFTPGLKHIIDGDYDILSVNEIGYFYSDFAIRRASEQGKKIILTPHFFFHTDKYKFIKEIYSKTILPGTLKKVDRLICFTETERKFWSDNFEFLSKKIVIIPHYFRKDRVVRIEHNNKTEEYLLYFGRAGRNKRTDLLIEAFNQLNINYKLYLTINKNNLSPRLLSIVNSNNNIQLLGHVTEKEKNKLLGNCVAIIFPTDYEAFGIVNFEASYFKKPLLVSSLDIFKNILDPKGVIYFENSVNSIKEVIVQFLSLGLKEKKEMGKINFKNLDNFTFKKITNKYSQLYLDLYKDLTI